MSDNPYIDSSGDIPSIRIAKFVTALVGIPVYAYLSGIIAAILEWGSGLNTTIEGIGLFLRGGVIDSLVDGLATAMGIAWIQNGQFLAETFGAVAPVVAAIEVAILMTLLAWLARGLLAKLLNPGWF